MKRHYKIVRVRSGFRYDPEYRASLQGSRDLAELFLTTPIDRLGPIEVAILKRGKKQVGPSGPAYEWKPVETIKRGQQ